MGLKATG